MKREMLGKDNDQSPVQGAAPEIMYVGYELIEKKGGP